MHLRIMEFRRRELGSFSTASAHSVTHRNRRADFFDMRDAGEFNRTLFKNGGIRHRA